MIIRLRFCAVAVFLTLFLTLPAFAQTICDVCGKPVHGKFYKVQDQIDGKQKKLCQSCEDIPDRCFMCEMPVKDGYKKLMDGRFICARDLKGVVESEAEAKDVCATVKNDLDRLFSRFLTMPADQTISLSIVDKFHLENLFHAPGHDNGCVSIYGATTSNPLGDGKLLHTIDILSHLQKSRLMAVCAHEYTHAWMNENLNPYRKQTLNRDTIEGFCEFVAYKYVESVHEEEEMANIKKNNYTRGQIHALLAADAKFGVNSVIEWMKGGEDGKVDLARLDRVRLLKDGTTTPAAALPTTALLYMPPAPPTPVPSTLVLKSISGTGQHRFAMINNATFESQEKGKVRVGTTSVSVVCLEIRNNSVLIQVDGAAEKKELFLRGQ